MEKIIFNKDIVKITKDNFICYYKLLKIYLDVAVIDNFDDYIVIDANISSSDYNACILVNDNISFDKDFYENAIKRFDDKNQAMALWSWVDIGKKINDIKMEFSYDCDIMCQFPKSFVIENKEIDGFKIKKFNSLKELFEFDKEVLKFFISPYKSNFLSNFIENLNFKEDKNFKEAIFIGFLNNTPIAKGTLMFSDDAIGVYDIFTLKEFQGMGLGTALFNFMLKDIKNDKRLCVLEATNQGKNIYKRANFKETNKKIYSYKNYFRG
ncbi:MAG: hypothetical protein BWY78_00288 [Alphaproteobacteria bacterium ADurb.Bin438]|nr:MAG: hypothetical protein BWY78_00288 [Alphaproteobacteria bacterium ADurb.Bin438]